MDRGTSPFRRQDGNGFREGYMVWNRQCHQVSGKRRERCLELAFAITEKPRGSRRAGVTRPPVNSQSAAVLMKARDWRAWLYVPVGPVTRLHEAAKTIGTPVAELLATLTRARSCLGFQSDTLKRT